MGDRFESIGVGGSTMTVDGNVLVSGNENVLYIYEKEFSSQQWIFTDRITKTESLVSVSR